MVSNKNRRTNFRDISVQENARKEFDKCAKAGETQTDTLLKIIRGYKRKCLDQKIEAN